MAEDLGVDHETVKARRRDLVATGEIPQLPEKVVGRDGREQAYAGRKKPAAKKPEEAEVTA